jgi:hypothetical protein
MVELRRASARIKAEPGLKRRFSDAHEEVSAKPAKAAKTTKSTLKTAPKPSPVQEPAVQILPSKLTDATPLPVLLEPQSEDLPDSEWQSIGDSGVFAASLARSRMAIAKGAFFDKFWTKPTVTKKQKDMTEEEKLQYKAAKGPTQSKVGTVTMISEPLAVEVHILMVKDQNPGQHRMGQLPPDKQHLIYGTPQRINSPAHATPYRPPVLQQPVYTPARPPPSITPHPAIPQPQVAVTPLQPIAAPARPAQASTQPTAKSSPATQAPRPAAPAASPQAPDPVIHALAQRASANQELKAVMKIVATGRASQQQLQYFQKHIDELTEIVKHRQEQEARQKAPAPAPPLQPATASPAPAATPQIVNPQPSSQIAPAPTPPQRPIPPVQTPTQYWNQPAPTTLPRPKTVISATPLHIVLQFNENPNERFLFPKQSILEFNHNLTEVICSFVVVKKGKNGKDLWTPVTLTFKGDAPTLSVLGRVVEHVELARRHMEESMLRFDRAEDGYLAFRLPHEPIAMDLT